MPSASPASRKRSRRESETTLREDSGLHPVLTSVDRVEAPEGARTQAAAPLERALGPVPLAPNYLELVREVWSRHFTLRSLPVTAGMAVAWTGVRAIAKSAQALDDRRYPEWRNQPVERPVFLFANMRSGTTLLHRLMALDEERFATIKLYQTIFPAVSVTRAIEKLRSYEGTPVGRALGSIPKLLQNTLLGGWKDAHPLLLDEPEEDECLFCISGHSQTLTLLFPFADELEELFFLDGHPREQRDELMNWYEATLKRFLFANGPTKRLLNKNVFTAPRLLTLHERFPDASFVYLVRHPYDSLGSYLDMFHRAWRVHRPEIERNSPEMRKYVAMALAHYRYALSCRSKIPKEQMLVVQYEELTKDPKATVERIYRELGLEVTPAFRENLVAATNAQKSFKSHHEYSLEDFGVTREWLREQLSEVYEEFGYET